MEIHQWRGELLCKLLSSGERNSDVGLSKMACKELGSVQNIISHSLISQLSPAFLETGVKNDGNIYSKTLWTRNYNVCGYVLC